MEDLGAKLKTGLKGLFGAVEDKRWSTKGTGRKLGSSDPAQGGSKVGAGGDAGRGRPQAPESSPRPVVHAPPAVRTPPQPLIAFPDRPSSSSITPLSSSARPSSDAPQVLDPSCSSRYSRSDAAQQAVLNTVVMASTPTGAERACLGNFLAARQAQGSLETGSPERPNGVPGSINTPTSAEITLGLGSSMLAESDLEFHLQQCLALVVSQDGEAVSRCLTTLLRLLRNVQGSDNPKYRTIRLGNPTIQSSIVNVYGAVDFLEAVGFQLVFGEVDEGGGLAPPAPQPARGSNSRRASATNTGSGAAADGGDGPGAAVRPVQWRGTDLSTSLQRRITDSLQAGGSSGAQGVEEGPLPPSGSSAGARPPAGSPAPSSPGIAVDAPSLPSPHKGTAAEGFLVLPLDASMYGVAVGQQELIKVMQVMGLDASPPAPAAPAAPAPPASPSLARAAGSPSAQSAPKAPAPARPPADRQTRVVLPVAPDLQIPEYFFERTAAELKAEVSALARRRAAGEVLATRAWRERAAAAAGGGSGPGAPPLSQQVATLRVRFPEGVCLQGCFGGWEPVTAVFDWLTESLRYAHDMNWEVVLPAARKALQPSGRVADVPDLWPTAILNFRMIGASPGTSNVPFLSDAMLARTQAE